MSVRRQERKSAEGRVVDQVFEKLRAEIRRPNPRRPTRCARASARREEGRKGAAGRDAPLYGRQDACRYGYAV